MQDYIKQFDTFDDFYLWLEAPVSGIGNGKSQVLILKHEFRSASINIVRKRVPGNNLAARNKAMEKIGYKERMQMVYEELHG